MRRHPRHHLTRKEGAAVMLRRYHRTEPDDADSAPDTGPDDTDAPQADKPAGRSRSRAKKEG
ncbi:hypothetical protein GCM10010389_66330 [Streptomyces echinoruber]|uniref:Uncharacterized protein n=1 Tax=Streptomyces echinoruber TaxID=68898 RepID=A0A918S0G4_9ACTN|nr:hypothetical protein GCM10010389_66330 [Streptomyces echinoruber]